MTRSPLTLVLTLLAGVLVATGAVGGQVRIGWDYPTNQIDHFVLYAGTNGFWLRVPVGTNKEAQVDQLEGRWQFAVSAMRSNVESTLSNTLIVDVPPAPYEMRTVILQYSETVTNWTDVGFFRVRIE